MSSIIFGRAPYAILVGLVSLASSGCKDDPVGLADASTSAAADARPADAPDASVEVPDAGPPPPPPEVCPREPATPVIADVNGDGVVEVADSIALLDHVFRGGRAPACAAAADFNGDGRVEADDGSRISTMLVTGAAGPRSIAATACASATPWPAGRCAPLAWDVAAPARATTAGFSAEIAVRSSTLAIQGWSMSLSASGCTIAAATTAGTSSAEIWDDPPGLRHLGYALTRPVEGGAIGYVVLSHHQDVILPPAERTVLMRIELEASVPAEGCAPCTVSVTSDRRWQGREISAVVVSDGRAYAPAPASATIEVCAP